MDPFLVHFENLANDRSEIRKQYEIGKLIFNDEIKLIKNVDLGCPDVTDKILTSPKLKEAVIKGFGDPGIYNAILCFHNSLSRFPEKALVGKNFKIRNYIKQLFLFGGSSSYGFAFLTQLSDQVSEKDSILVAKVSRRPENPELLHEYFIGAFGTNKLRNQIPNFSYILGYFDCSSPYVAKVGKVNETLTFCQTNRGSKQTPYVLYELVDNSMQTHIFISKCTESDFLNIFSQVVLSLTYAWQEIGFSHNDLHTGNILIRELDQPIYITYPIGDETFGCYTKYIATFIDYGRGAIKYNDKYYGFAYPEIDVLPERSYPVGDIFKFLGTCLLDIGFKKELKRGESDDFFETKNKPVFNLIKELLAFFLDGLENKAIDKFLPLEKYGVSLPFYNIEPITYLAWLIKNFKEKLSEFLFLVTPESQLDESLIYGCHQKCTTTAEAVKEFLTDKEEFVKNPYILYELWKESSPRTPVYNKLLKIIEKDFSYYMDFYYDRLNEKVAEYNNILNNKIQKISYKKEAKSNYDVVLLDKYNIYLDNLALLSDLAADIKNLCNIIIELTRDFKLLKYKHNIELDVIKNIPLLLAQNYIKNVDNIKADYFYVQDILEKNELIPEALKKYLTDFSKKIISLLSAIDKL